MNIYSLQGVTVFILLLICSASYLRRVPKLKPILFYDKRGFLGGLYKASVIGIRLHWLVSLCCLLAAVFIVF